MPKMPIKSHHDTISMWSDKLGRWLGENEEENFQREFDPTPNGSRGLLENVMEEDLMLIPHPDIAENDQKQHACSPSNSKVPSHSNSKVQMQTQHAKQQCSVPQAPLAPSLPSEVQRLPIAFCHSSDWRDVR